MAEDRICCILTFYEGQHYLDGQNCKTNRETRVGGWLNGMPAHSNATEKCFLENTRIFRYVSGHFRPMATKERIYNMMPYNIWIRDTVKCVRGRDIYGEKSGDRPTVTYNLYGGALKPALRPNPKTGCVLNTVL